MEHYNTKLNEGHAVAAEQKIREFKNVFKPNEALKKATNNMNIQPTRKYGIPPNKVENKNINYPTALRELEKLIRMRRGTPGTISKGTKSKKRNLGLLYRLAKSYLFYPAE